MIIIIINDSISSLIHGLVLTVRKRKLLELATSQFDVKSFQRQSRSLGSEIAIICKSNLGHDINLKRNFDSTLISFEVVHVSITLQHWITFFCVHCPAPYLRSNLMFSEYLHDLIDYINNLTGHVSIANDVNIPFENLLKSLTKQTFATLCLHTIIQVIDKPAHKCSHITDWHVVPRDDNIHRRLLSKPHLNQTIIA